MRLNHQTTAVERAVATAMWYRKQVDAPAHWQVKRREDLLGSVNYDGNNVTWELVSSGSWKRVYRALLRPFGTHEPQRVIVKKSSDDGTHGEAALGELFNELIYLDYCRGRPGVPFFLGAFREAPRMCTSIAVGKKPGTGGVTQQQQPCDGSIRIRQLQPVIYVVTRDSGGERLGKNFGASAVVSASYERLARERPLALTRAMLECFQTFSERGGFILRDFTPQQFVLAPLGERGVSFELVDGPTPAAGPMQWLADFFRSGETDFFNRSTPATLQDRTAAIAAAAASSYSSAAGAGTQRLQLC